MLRFHSTPLPASKMAKHRHPSSPRILLTTAEGGNSEQQLLLGQQQLSSTPEQAEHSPRIVVKSLAHELSVESDSKIVHEFNDLSDSEYCIRLGNMPDNRDEYTYDYGVLPKSQSDSLIALNGSCDPKYVSEVQDELNSSQNDQNSCENEELEIVRNGEVDSSQLVFDEIEQIDTNLEDIETARDDSFMNKTAELLESPLVAELTKEQSQELLDASELIKAAVIEDVKADLEEQFLEILEEEEAKQKEPLVEETIALSKDVSEVLGHCNEVTEVITEMSAKQSFRQPIHDKKFKSATEIVTQFQSDLTVPESPSSKSVKSLTALSSPTKTRMLQSAWTSSLTRLRKLNRLNKKQRSLVSEFDSDASSKEAQLWHCSSVSVPTTSVNSFKLPPVRAHSTNNFEGQQHRNLAAADNSCNSLKLMSSGISCDSFKLPPSRAQSTNSHLRQLATAGDSIESFRHNSSLNTSASSVNLLALQGQTTAGLLGERRRSRSIDRDQLNELTAVETANNRLSLDKRPSPHPQVYLL